MARLMRLLMVHSSEYLIFLHHSWRAKVGAVHHAAVAIGVWIDDRRVAGDQVGRELPAGRPDAEAMAGEAGREIEAGQRVDRRDHRYAVGRGIDHAAPGSCDLQARQGGVVLAQPLQPQLYQLRVGRRIERAMALERRGFVERPARKSLRPIEERPPNAERDACAPLLEGRPELPGIEQALRRQLDNPAPAETYRVAAIEATADRDVGHRQPTLCDRR